MLSFRSILAFAGALVLSATANAQGFCFGDDGFNIPGACCAPVNPNLPQFPGVTVPSAGGIFKNCILATQFPATIVLSPPAQLFPDIFITQIQIIGGTVNINPGLLICKYSRTWIEVTNAGTLRQVWRFLINADLNYIVPASATAPIPYPQIALNGQPVHFMGSLDYAFDCTPVGGWSTAINLTYLCGDFMHNQYSAQPMSANPNPNHVYCFVGPTPFNFGVGGPPAGVVVADAVRSNQYNFSATPLLWQAFSETPVFGGLLQTVNNYCACALPGPSAPQWSEQQLQFNYGCNAASPFPFSLLPWFLGPTTGLTSMIIGTYATPPSVYPSQESINLYFGLANSQDPCVNAFPFHAIMGIGTRGGDQAWIVNQQISPNPIPTAQFLDLANMMILIGGPPYITIGMGGIFLSTQLWQLNM
jgi:hypothetical protein